MTTHKLCDTREYAAWSRMKRACYDPRVAYYHKYGGKGVGVCDDWRNNFIQFYADMGPMPPVCNGIGLKDPDSDFCKINCHWTVKRAGRPQLHRLKQPKGRRTRMENPRSICLILEYDLLEYIKRQAMQKSIEKGSYIEPNQLMREALAMAFPLPQQMDAFGGKL